ncbi:MAG: extracellular solute-binding protein [Propionivibrio sp.]
MIRLRAGLIGCFCLALLLVVVLPTPASAETIPQRLRVLAWPGYADPDVVKVFEQRTNSRVEVTIVDSDAVLWQKVAQNDAAAEEAFDVIAVNTAELRRYIHARLVQPIALGSVPNVAAQLPRFRDLRAIPGLVHDGAVYGVPYAYAEMGLIYDRRQVATAPDSIAALWDERYRGKVLAFDDGTHNFSLAAQSLAMADPFRIGDQDWPAVVERLIALRRNVLTFYAKPEESVELFRTRNAALMLANYGSQQLQLMQAAGADVGYAIPKEGALAWLDCWAVTRKARDKRLAESWINYMLEPDPSDVLIRRHGLDSTTRPAGHHRESDRLIWLQPAENVERRNELWSRIVSGDRLGKVMAP